MNRQSIFTITTLIGRCRQAGLPSLLIAVVLASWSSPSVAQEVRYSWLDISFMGQDVGKSGSQLTPVPGQFVDADAKDGDGIRFRGSIGTWHNLYAFVDYGSTDIDVDVLVTNTNGTFPASDEFDYTTIRSGVGVRFPLSYRMDIFAEVSYDSLDLDFGTFAGESFDTDAQGAGGTLGIRMMATDDFEIRAHGRYSNQADVDLTTLLFDSGALYGVGFGWQLVQGFSLVGDYESGEFSSWSIGFRLDLDED